MKHQTRQHGSEYTNQEDNTNRYALSRIIEETQKLQAVYWFNLFLIVSLGLEACWGYQTQLTSITERRCSSIGRILKIVFCTAVLVS